MIVAESGANGSLRVKSGRMYLVSVDMVWAKFFRLSRLTITPIFIKIKRVFMSVQAGCPG